MCTFVFSLYGDLRALHVLTQSFPTRRSSDLRGCPRVPGLMPPGNCDCCRAGPRLAGYPTRRRPTPDRVLHGREYARCRHDGRSEEHTSELQSLMRISYAVFCLKKKTTQNHHQAILAYIHYIYNTKTQK